MIYSGGLLSSYVSSKIILTGSAGFRRKNVAIENCAEKRAPIINYLALSIILKK